MARWAPVFPVVGRACSHGSGPGRRRRRRHRPCAAPSPMQASIHAPMSPRWRGHARASSMGIEFVGIGFESTRGGSAPAGIDDALVAGLAPDGGLYVPRRFPRPRLDAPLATLADTATEVLAPWFEGSRLRDRLPAMCARAFAFDTPLRPLRGDGDWLLELFHGPTAAFKDYAARFLAEALAGLREANGDAMPPTTILVAPSGGTGAAVAAAIHRRPGFNVAILYPDGGVSPRQAHGLGCWGDNVRAFRVAGTFDDCQRMVKQALGDAGLRREVPLAAANSISLGRLLPQ